MKVDGVAALWSQFWLEISAAIVSRFTLGKIAYWEKLGGFAVFA